MLNGCNYYVAESEYYLLFTLRALPQKLVDQQHGSFLSEYFKISVHLLRT